MTRFRATHFVTGFVAVIVLALLGLSMAAAPIPPGTEIEALCNCGMGAWSVWPAIVVTGAVVLVAGWLMQYVPPPTMGGSK